MADIDLNNIKSCSRNGGIRSGAKGLPFYILVGIIVLVFAMFWLIGYNRTYDEDPNFNAPLFTDLLLITAMLLLIGAVAVAAWSVVKSLKVSGRGERVSNNIPVRKIGTIVAVGTFAVMLLTFILGSSEPMTINGSTYDDTLGLKLSGMFISTSLLMIAAAIIAVLYGSTKYIRKP